MAWVSGWLHDWSVKEDDEFERENARALRRMSVACVILSLFMGVSAYLSVEGLRLTIDLVSSVTISSGFAAGGLLSKRYRSSLGAFVASLSLVGTLIIGDIWLGAYSDKIWFMTVGVVFAGFGLETRMMWLAYAIAMASMWTLPLWLPGHPIGTEEYKTLIIDVTILVTGMTLFMHSFVASARRAQDKAKAQLEEAQLQRQRAEGAALQAQVASNSKSMFLANVSHELRTPLNAIMGYAELMMEEAEDSGETANEDLAKIHTAAKHLRAVIDDILDLTRIEAGRIQLSPENFVLGELIEELMATMKPLAQMSYNELVLRIDPSLKSRVLHMDRTRLRQILLNLLSNACKFTERGVIMLEVEHTERGGAPHLEMRVRDTGIGMDEALLGRLFEPFVQASISTPSRQGGTGLGLVITRRILQLMGGDVEVRSELGRGSEFRLWLPLTAGRERRATLLPGALPAIKRPAGE